MQLFFFFRLDVPVCHRARKAEQFLGEQASRQKSVCVVRALWYTCVAFNIPLNAFTNTNQAQKPLRFMCPTLNYLQSHYHSLVSGYFSVAACPINTAENVTSIIFNNNGGELFSVHRVLCENQNPPIQSVICSPLHHLLSEKVRRKWKRGNRKLKVPCCPNPLLGNCPIMCRWLKEPLYRCFMTGPFSFCLSNEGQIYGAGQSFIQG